MSSKFLPLKVVLKDNHSEIIDELHIKSGKVYDATLCPTIYDPNTFRALPRSYIIKCDGEYRKVPAKYFITISELRHNKLNQLGL
jgi:hypothetical protein